MSQPDASNLDALLKQVGDKRRAHLILPQAASGAMTPMTPEDHLVENTTGYMDTVFSGKKAQAAQVQEILEHSGFIPHELVSSEVAWFYEHLGMDDMYFALETTETIASHILSLYGAKIVEYTKHTGHLDVDLQKKSADSAVFIHSSPPGVSRTGGTQWERLIDEQYLNKSSVECSFRLETYRSTGRALNQPETLRSYFLQRCEFAQPIPKPDTPEFQNIRAVSDKTFRTKASPNTLAIYQAVMEEALRRQGPVIEMFEVVGTQERRIVIAYRMGTTSNFFSALSDLYHFYGLYSSRKYVEHFSNGITVISIYLNPLPQPAAPPIELSVFQIIKEVSLIYVLPDNPFFTGSGAAITHAVQEAAYAYVGWTFAQHFCNRLGSTYEALHDVLDESNAHQAAILNEIKIRFREETFTRQSIFEVIENYPQVIRLLYVHFANIHYPGPQDQELLQTLSRQRLTRETLLTDQQMSEFILKSAGNAHERQVLMAFLMFNKAVRKTNFYTPTKVALSFRLDASFLPRVEYPHPVYGIIFVVGIEFCGFHVRFADIARGGVRVIRSRNREMFSINQRTLFDECYNLARTQHLKNKDIPEGGAKGAILPSMDVSPRLAFEKYVDAVLDLLIKGATPGVKDTIVDLIQREEILFLGPDEGTADFMDWGAEHARARGAPWWKSFTTGKSAALLGGVPHDEFGMTSRSIRQYILGIFRKHNLREADITKVQTGGPDGDLGSNEILLSMDKTVAIIDGSGVLYDPQGLDRRELIRLAKARETIANFDPSTFHEGGYRVLVEDRNVTLPSGECIADGIAFRNTAHLRYEADLFVPCGGRPEAINISNVEQMCGKDGRCHYKYIVEGANLFITRLARLELEKRGVILYPDASANKGGVTSSSLEVLVGLGLTDEEYIADMLYHDGKPTPFYMDYVHDIQHIITRNAAAEFEAIWREHERTGKPRSVISTELSLTLNKISQEIETTQLYDQETLRHAVLSDVFPKSLLNKAGMDPLVKRVPHQYLRSAFAANVAATFVYAKGTNASYIDFYNHINGLLNPRP
ncbi:glutamate dehydrogenase [Malassezia sp. CBS 17886]|nr:glutamate dehydrogenase [Malassezia sp. CBS 17886]